MQSRREQLQAHSFIVGRLMSGVATGDIEAPRGPLRRQSVGLSAGVMVAVLLMAGTVVMGFLSPGGSTAWQKANTLVQEKETATRYVYVGGVLHPVLNYASAKLLLGSSMTITSASTSELKGTPHGAAVGIPDAPDALPAPAGLTSVPWLVCATAAPDVSGTPRPNVTVAVGGVTGASTLDATKGVLVQTPDGAQYLLWQQWRLRIGSAAVAVGLNLTSVAAVPVSAAWLDTIPAGPDLVSPPVPGRGGPGPRIAGQASTIGRLYTVHNVSGPDGTYLALAEGLEPITATQAALILADPAEKAAYQGGSPMEIPLGISDLAAAPRLAAAAPVAGSPETPPTMTAAGPGSTPCMSVAFTGTTEPRYTLALTQQSTLDRLLGGPQPPSATATVANRVVVAPDTGMLVRSLPAPPSANVVAGTDYLVTDTGAKYPLDGGDVPGVLGYQNAGFELVPPELLDLFPTGPALSRAAATQTASAGVGDGASPSAIPTGS
ncbi:type VII secretion protein EccB [Catenulispora pinisilvae]|uniref:type VII secretion protein EccB n=1 Tax=Catenulispora pinisilvae TaxID=2705253 RepID=UPI0018925CB7|nr:type VII secretion protein EccB [Catenulispora pinisilvae]